MQAVVTAGHECIPPFHSTHLKSCRLGETRRQANNASVGVKPPRNAVALLCLQPHLFCRLHLSPEDDVMAAHSAVRAINSQEITDKARRDLLHLLEGVCKTPGTAFSDT